MSGVVSAVGTVFRSVATTAANVGSSIMGVGASLFTGGAATGATGSALGGMFSGTLGNVIGGAVRTGAIGALVGGAVGAATGQGFGKGAMTGGLAGAAMGGLGAAMGQGASGSGSGIEASPGQTATGVSATGSLSAPQSTVGSDMFNPSLMTEQGHHLGASAAPAAGNGLGRLFQGETGGQILAGAGQGAMAWMEAREARKQAEADRAHELQLLQERENQTIRGERRQEQRYEGMPVMAKPQDSSQGKQTPGERYSRSRRYAYDPAQGRIVFSA